MNDLTNSTAELLTQVVNELKALRQAVERESKEWLTSEEACQMLGMPATKYQASRQLLGLENHLIIRNTKPKMVCAKSVKDLLEKVRTGEVVIRRTGDRTRAFRV